MSTGSADAGDGGGDGGGGDGDGDDSGGIGPLGFIGSLNPLLAHRVLYIAEAYI